MVYFVGAGTGAADLITVRGMRLLERADVVIYAGSLVNPQLLAYTGEACELYNSAEMTLEEVLAVMRRAETEGRMTVRLHTGDPSIYGAVREQMDELDRAGIAYESCPGVSACFGAAASLNLEYTLPGISQSLIITRMEGKTKVPERESIEKLAAHHASMAVYLSAGMLEELSRRLTAGGYGSGTPAALVYKATWPEEETYICTVGSLPAVAQEHGITRTALVLVGDVITHRYYQKSRLYASDFSTEFRKAKKNPEEVQTDWRRSEKDESKCQSGILMPLSAQACFGTGERGRLCIISFTEKGRRLSEKIAREAGEMEVRLFTKCADWMQEVKDAHAGGDTQPDGRTQTERNVQADGNIPVEVTEVPVGEWAGEQMREKHALLFIGACGIAVRAAAPWLTDKLHDSPVLVMDEDGRYVVPILSGHMGGANELALYLSGKTGAEPVITTATDRRRKFAVDLFAKRNGLSIADKEGIARVSSKVLAGKEITVSIETGHWRGEGRLPEGVRITAYPPEQPVDVLITSENSRAEASLLLKPKEYVIGMGCRRGKEAEKIEAFILHNLEKAGIPVSQVLALSSVSQKSREKGLIAWCQKEGIPFLTYTAEELQNVEGDFHASSFVKEQVGVDNVCERAALKTCGQGGQLVCGKCCFDGMTAAIARREWWVEFEEI